MYQKTTKTFDAFHRQYEDVFNVDCKEWSNEKKVRLLLRKLGSTQCSRFVDFILLKKQWIWSSQKQLNYYLNYLGQTSLFYKGWKCLNIVKEDQQDYLTFAATVNKQCKDFKLADLTADDFKYLIFAQGLVSAEDAEIRRHVN